MRFDHFVGRLQVVKKSIFLYTVDKFKITLKSILIKTSIFFKFMNYRGADKSLARIDNSYVKIKHINCISSL